MEKPKADIRNYFKRKVCFRQLFVLTLASRVGLMHLPLDFSNLTGKGGLQRLRFFQYLIENLCATFGKKKWPGHFRSRSYDVTNGKRSDHFFAKNSGLLRIMRRSCTNNKVNLDHWPEPDLDLDLTLTKGIAMVKRGKALNSNMIFIWDTVASLLRQCKQ